MKYLRHLRWFAPTLLIGWVLWQSLVSPRPLVRVSSFIVRTPVLDVLLPAARVEARPQGVAVLREPVYIDVTLPPRARAATLELDVAEASAPLKLGLQQGAGFDISFPEIPVVAQGGTRRYTLRASEFTHLEPGYRLRFVISAPGTAPGSIVVQGARIAIERQPFSFAWLGAALKGEAL